MNKIKITTPENIEVEYTLADIGSRTAAVFIDSLIQLVAFIILGIAVFVIATIFPDFWLSNYGWVIGIAMLVAALIGYAYFVVAEVRMNGRTPGKKLLKIRTIRNNGQPITFTHSIIRNLFKVFIDIFGVGVTLMFINKEHKRIGDMVASTIVVIEDNKTKPITLESLQQVKENYEHYLSPDENELLREYLERKNNLEDYTQIREQLKMHFTEKFQAMGILDEWRMFIDQL